VPHLIIVKHHKTYLSCVRRRLRRSRFGTPPVQVRLCALMLLLRLLLL
jgi:hypothetical protein